jgi:Ferritin-like domain
VSGRDESLPLDPRELDVDGALEQAFAVRRVSRATLLGAGLGGGLLVALGRPGGVGAFASGDVSILNYALTLEYLQAAFYTEAERVGALRGRSRQAARVLGSVERAHVAALRKALGSAAVGRPRFNFQGTTEDPQKFLKTAVAFEDLAVAAYKGQAPAIRSDALLAAAVSIHSVEARHAAWMRHLFGLVPAASAFDEPESRSRIKRVVDSTHFIAAGAKTTGKGKPRYTG